MQHYKFIDFFQPLPLPQEIQQWDGAAIELGIPQAVLMENAAQEAFAVLKRYHHILRNKIIWFFMGSGNNGGDAACMARYAQNAGAVPIILHRKPLTQYKGMTAKQIRVAQALSIPFYRLRHSSLNSIPFPTADIIVDGLLGTGFQGELKLDVRQLIENINTIGTKAFVLALDIPSGLDGKTGLPCPVAIRADATATFAALKPGLVQSGAKNWAGNIHLCTIGFPKELHGKIPCSSYLLKEECLDNLLTFPDQSYKNIFGHVCIIGGASGLEGAAHLAARSALRTGAGLVTALTAEKSLPLVKCNWPEIMGLSLEMPRNEPWPARLSAELKETLQRFSTLVIGPGLGRKDNVAAFLKEILQLPKRPPAVIDADALTLIGRHKELLTDIRSDDMLTPHPGEAASLLNISNQDIQQNRFESLQQLCRMQKGVVILKGAYTLIGQHGFPYLVSPYDIPQLAVGGSGDVLAGCLGALRARDDMGMGSFFIAAQGVLLHALAGMSCAQKFSGRGNRASEIADALSEILNRTVRYRYTG